MPVVFKLSGTSFNQELIKTLQLNQDVQVTYPDILDENDSDIEDLDGLDSNPPIKCCVDNNLVGYVPRDTKKRVKELLKQDKKFKIYRLNTFKDNPTIGVRLISV